MISASATDEATGLPIPYPQISIGQFGNLDTNGHLYVVLPDNDPDPLTPLVAGITNYTRPAPSATGFALHLYQNGTDITGSNVTAIVGQQINLSCALVGPSGSTPPPITNYLWTVPGNTFSNYVANASTGTLYKDFSKTNSYVVYYWADQGNEQIQCSVMVNGRTITAQTTFKVARPNATLTATVTGQIFADNNCKKTGTYLHFGGNKVGTNTISGITFIINNADVPGNYFFVQTGQTTTTQLWNGTNYVGICNLGVDDGTDRGDYVYQIDTSLSSAGTDDSPATQLLPQFTTVGESDSFTMYLMFTPVNNGRLTSAAAESCLELVCNGDHNQCGFKSMAINPGDATFRAGSCQHNRPSSMDNEHA